MRRYHWIAVAGVFSLVIALASAWWFLPFGTGEYRISPDGRYEARAENVNQGTLFRGRVDYIRLTVLESGTNREIWRAYYFHEPEAKIPDYADRSQKPFITWAPNSSSVSIPVENGQQVTLTLP
ncbi:MAG TPA: hypothetical protein VFE62_18640 [Gemmataceae bacterium]|nr:hypothetical protein [Gemmataceae bacterium]